MKNSSQLQGDSFHQTKLSETHRSPELLQQKAVPISNMRSQATEGESSVEETVSIPPAQHQHAALPRHELLVYAGLIVFILVYMHWHLYQLSKERASDLELLDDGLSVFGKWKKDISHGQWTTFIDLMTTPSVTISYVAYILLGQLVALFAPQFRKAFMLVFSVLWICLGFGIQTLEVLLLHSFVVYVVSHSRKQMLVWIVVLLSIASVTVETFMNIQERYIAEAHGGTMCILISSLRLLCFGMEFCCNTTPEKPLTGYNIYDLLLFNFYLPVFPYGPIVGYDTFLVQINAEVKPLTWRELKVICKEFMRCITWAVITESITYFLYLGALTYHHKTVMTLGARDLSLLALYHLFFFQLTTFVPYSFSRVLALCDRIDVPQPPICILSIHFFRDMWRYFDRGLNIMFTKYIYIPLGGSKHGPLRQSFSVLMCFLFVAFWHGGGQMYFTWGLLNWIGVQVEAAALAFDNSFGPLQNLKKSMSPAMLRRFYAACAVPNYLFLAFSNLLSVIGPSRTRFFISAMMFKDWPWNFLCIIVAFYCCMQVVNELERRVGKKVLLSKDYF
ncbi:protein-cysteine N-palmitoyltransferase HHAT-like isoform X2 [Acanthaster planci]|uniref:Protein-cysteine N-palmitoyltransferase HHAT-like isoform X2 n=1 Tax=Acanthaster planci TaxID=133434 RepID=A0A8B7Y5X8_ACAPL|nr:protein-cysteine N-palmitoyltransferase HHAT-like isoform X2 [Acanthaster planci]